MAAEAKCANCKHRGARNICYEVRSPRHGTRVEPTDRCNYFIENPAEEHLVNGMVASLSDDQLPTEINELEKAIALGLPEDSEMQARYFLGNAYRRTAGRSGLPVAQMVRTAEFSRALSEQEKAVRMDRDRSYGYFSEPGARGLLRSLDTLFVLRSGMIGGEQGAQAAIAFLEEKIQLGDHFSTSPFLQMLLDLGNLYAESGAKDRAAACYERISRAEPVDDEDGIEAEVRAMAANNLRTISGIAAHTPGSGCMVIIAVLGLVLGGAWRIWSLL